MIASMTAFSHVTFDNEWGSFTWELRSVNHRFLELSVYLPNGLHHLELSIREQIQQSLKRGKVRAELKYQSGKKSPCHFVINEKLLDELSQASQKVRQFFPDMQVSMTEILSWNGVMQVQENSVNEMDAAVMESLKKALHEMSSMRHREGAGLQKFIEEKLSEIKSQQLIVQSKMPNVIDHHRKNLLKKFADLQLNVDPMRLEQETLFLVQKLDVVEELQRLDSHVIEVQNTLNQGGMVGRRLDFLMQELNREANTLSSKSIDIDITQSAVEIKVLIEQMREQVQNIE